MSNKSLTRLKAKTIELGSSPALNFFELAKNLADLHEEDAGSIADIPEKTGMSRRRLYYLLDVGQLIAASEIAKSEAEEIGWTKLQIIARHVKEKGTLPEATAGFMDIAGQTKAHALRDALRGNDHDRTKAVMFRLNAIQRSDLNEALLKFGAAPARTGLTGKASALMKIIGSAGRGRSVQRRGPR